MQMSKWMACLIVVGSLAVACDSDDGGATAAGPTVTSLRSDVVPVVSSFCGACHKRANSPSPDAVANGMFFETAEDLLGLIAAGQIVAGDGAASPLVKVMSRTLGVGADAVLMPPAPLSGMPTADIDVVMAWIDEGAKDN